MSSPPAVIALFLGMVSTGVQASYPSWNQSSPPYPTVLNPALSGPSSGAPGQDSESYGSVSVHKRMQPCHHTSPGCNNSAPYYPYSNHNASTIPSSTQNIHYPLYTGVSQHLTAASGYPAPTGYLVAGPTQYIPGRNTTATVTIAQPCPSCPHTTYTAPPFYVPTHGPSNQTTVTVLQPCATCPATVYCPQPTSLTLSHYTPLKATTLTVVESCYACPTSFYGGPTMTGTPRNQTHPAMTTISETRTVVVSQMCPTCPATSSLVKLTPTAAAVPVNPDFSAVIQTSTVTILHPCPSCPVTTITTSKPTATPVAPGISRSAAPYPLVNNTIYTGRIENLSAGPSGFVPAPAATPEGLSPDISSPAAVTPEFEVPTQSVAENTVAENTAAIVPGSVIPESNIPAAQVTPSAENPGSDSVPNVTSSPAFEEDVPNPVDSPATTPAAFENSDAATAISGGPVSNPTQAIEFSNAAGKITVSATFFVVVVTLFNMI